MASLVVAQTPEEQQCLASALPLLQKHALADAEARLAGCQRQYPQSAILSNALGIIYEQEGRKPEATKAFEKALELLPSFTAAQIHLGTLYAQAGNCDPAKRLLGAAAASTRDSGALVASGIGLAQCHDLAASIRVLNMALQSNPQSASAAYNLALAHYENGEFQDSLRILKSLPDGQDADVLLLEDRARQAVTTQTALEFIHQEHFGEAAALLENALKSTPPSVNMFSALGLARFRLGRYAEAIEAYSKAIEVDPSLEAPREGLGFLLYMTGDLERARSVVEAGIPSSGSKFYLLYLRALILYRQSSELRSEALSSVSACIEKNAKFAPAYFLRGKIRSDENQLRAALEDFEAAVRIDPKYALPYYRMSRIYSQLGRAAEAEEAARQFSTLGSSREDDVLTRQAGERLTPEPER